MTQPTPDPYLWLEEVQGERALAWVRERNAESEKRLQADPGFAERRRQIREVLDAADRIPYVSRTGEHFYNLWKDAANPRGLWRRTTLAEYRKPQPAWETVLDLDALGRAEGENWTWGGATCLGPAYRRCLVALSRGGADAAVVREFDLVDKRFVAGGFQVPEAKTQVAWLDADTVYVGTDFGPGSLTDSGYARVFKRWKRGQPLNQAATVFEGETKDVAASLAVDATPGFERTLVARALDFYNERLFLLQDGKPVAVAKPDDAKLQFWRERVLIELRSDWALPGRTWPRGSLLVADAAAYLKGGRDFTALFTPSATRSLAGFSLSRSVLLINVLDNVASRLEEWSVRDGRWQRREVAAPFPGDLTATALHDPLLARDELAEDYLLNAADFLQPDSLQLGRTGSDERSLLKTRPGHFDASGVRVEQRFATSKDGTRVPYFVIWPQGAQADGDNPTLLYGYGGFEVSLTPWYSGARGRVWTARGGVYVVANIRGGGEFGPGWHQAALRENKQKSYDDFAAVAEDLIARKVTRPARLGIQGGSNGGLLVGAVMLQRPELFAAVVCQVPLLDMQRFHKLLAGASWMAEYGNPDQGGDWAFLSRYSPYQNVKAGARLPRVLFTTSTRDDRVHPGHARKMAARMMELGHAPLYWENIEGGHGGAADNTQLAQMMALEYSFLWQVLGSR
ncbi:prolyl oligopeptidase family serine peptidase [Rubrivivax sp. A210]|uniref:prolyl oligopeptidase family serine peptidase n=1 Tax=Rubrivivax sp. A210 TaxID=2772301 RepID=UPI001917A86A|nr:prolyl oligopeptidase family serine peptidase [Rubrivivax sp. A210]